MLPDTQIAGSQGYFFSLDCSHLENKCFYLIKRHSLVKGKMILHLLEI